MNTKVGKKVECQTINCYNKDIYILTRKEFDLLVYNEETNKMHYVAQIDGSSYYTTSCVVEDKIIFLPVYTNVICEYCISSDTIRYIPVKITNSDKPLRECWTCVVYDGYIYVACGSKSLPLIRIDPNTYVAESISKWNVKFENMYGKQAVVCSNAGLCIEGNAVWLTLNEPNVILQYDLAEDTYRFHKVQTNETMFYTINCDGENIWLTGEEKAIYKWRPKDGTINVLSNFPTGFKSDKHKSDWNGLFYVGFQNEHDILYLPLSGNMIIKCDKEKGELKKIGENCDDKYCFHAFQLLDGQIYAEFDTRGSCYMSESVIVHSTDNCRCFGLYKEDVDASDSRFAEKNNAYKPMIYKESYKGMLSAYITALFD